MSEAKRLVTRPVRQLFLCALALLLATQLALSFYAWTLAENRLLPELGRKTQTVSASLSAKLERALDYGIPLARLEGVSEYFADVLKQNDDLAYLSVTNANGAPLFGSSQPDIVASDEFLDTVVPLKHAGVTVGALHVGVDKRYVAARVRELRYDIGIVLLTSLLIAFELLWFVVTLNFTAPMRQIVARMMRLAAGDFRLPPAASTPAPTRTPGVAALSSRQASLTARLDAISQRVNLAFDAVLHKAAAVPSGDNARQAATQSVLQGLRKKYRFGSTATDADPVRQRVVLVRVLSFLFMFAEMLSRPFLPVYAAALPTPGFITLPDGLRASLPITAFLLGVALSMPLAGRWSDRVGRRRSYISGALLVMAGLAITGMVPSYFVLVGARAATGIGYAMMFMACQGYVFDNTNDSNRAKGMSLFVGAIMVAEICSPAVGGILADRIGYQLVFLLGAVVAVTAALLASVVLHNRRAGGKATPRNTSSRIATARRLAPLRQLVRNRRFLALSILSGIPAKFLYSGFLIFLVPVLLSSLGCTKSEIGRYTMLYGFSCLALGPLFARLADRYNAYALLVVTGGLLSGAGMLPVLEGASPQLVMLGVAALGLGQAMSISAQLVLVARVTQVESRRLGMGPIVGMFRLLERLGAAAGPLVTGALVSHWGAQQAMVVLGIFGLSTALLFMLAFLSQREKAGAQA